MRRVHRTKIRRPRLVTAMVAVACLAAPAWGPAAAPAAAAAGAAASALRCTATVSNQHPYQDTSVTVRVRTASRAAVRAVAKFARPVTRTTTASRTGRASVRFAVGKARVGVRVPVAVTVSKSGRHATCSTSFTPAARPLPCVAGVSTAHPYQNSAVTVSVRTAAHAAVKVTAKFPTPVTRTGTASSAGVMSAAFPVGTARSGTKVAVTVSVTSGARHGACGTAFTPRASINPGAAPALKSLSAGHPLTSTVGDVQDWVRSTWCPTKPVAAKPPLTLAQAITNVRALLAARESSAALSGFAKSAAAKDPAAAVVAAIEGLVAERPGAALDALLAAHAKQPSDPNHLVNAAGILVSLSRPREALAFLDAAETLPTEPSATLAVRGRAVMQVNRGLALVELGQFAAAAPALTEAAKLSPELTEASQGLLVANTCLNKPATSKLLLAGVRRSSTPPPPDIVDPDDPSVSLPDAAAAYPVTSGVASTIPGVLPIPDSPQQLFAGGDSLYQLMQDTSAADMAAMTAMYDAYDAAAPAHDKLPPISQQRQDDLDTVVNYIDDQPSVAAVHKVFIDAAEKFETKEWEVFEPYGGQLAWALDQAGDWDKFAPVCRQIINQTHPEMVQLAKTMLAAGKPYVAEMSRLASAVAANTSDPLWHNYLSAEIDWAVKIEWANEVGDVELWISAENNYAGCYDIGSGDQQVGDQPVGTKHSDPCPDLFRDWKPSFDLGFVSVSFDCDQLSVEVGSPGVIGPFVKGDFGKTGYTVMVGMREGVSIPGLQASAKEGVYVSVGRDGGVNDAGFKIEAGASAGGPVTISLGDTAGSLSVVGAMSGLGY